MRQAGFGLAHQKTKTERALSTAVSIAAATGEEGCVGGNAPTLMPHAPSHPALCTAPTLGRYIRGPQVSSLSCSSIQWPW